ncbi:MAG: enoyl-CoA hydratase/isomerase family protein [Deltaproteobacteria bacterium]|nr:enoyl-CoA hydratase/isomerase family protein [Deltaproteobacteria bacterium]
MSAGLAAEIERWSRAEPALTGHDFDARLRNVTQWSNQCIALLGRLPAPAKRNANELELAADLKQRMHATKRKFTGQHTERLYRGLKHSRRGVSSIDAIVFGAAEEYPGFVPSREAMALERARSPREREGWELDQALLLSGFLAHPRVGAEIVATMRQPKPESIEHLARFRREGALDLGAARLRRRGKAALIEICRPDSLNAEDEELLAAQEALVDVVLLADELELGILRGAPVHNRKYEGRRVFCSGINLDHLYAGKLSYLFYVTRELGFVNKLYRGLAHGLAANDELATRTTEKAWIAVVDSHAIGGGCQLLLVVDYVLGEKGSFCSIPARHEGFIPGLANLRLPRYVGQRLAQEMIYFNKKVTAESAEGGLIFDQVVATDAIETALDRVVESISSSGVLGLGASRRAFRLGQEPSDTFREYMAAFAIEQAECLVSPQLSANLERQWVGARDKRREA